MPAAAPRLPAPAVALATAFSVPTAPLAPAHQRRATHGELPPKERLAAETYVRPQAVIERLVTAPRQNNVSLSNQSPNRKYFLKLQTEGLPSVQAFGKPHYYLARSE